MYNSKEINKAIQEGYKAIKAKAKAGKGAKKTGEVKDPAGKGAKKTDEVKGERATEAAKVERFKAVKLPAHFTYPNGDELTITERSITYSRGGLMEVIFNPLHVYQYTQDVTEANGVTLAQPIKAGWACVRRGTVCVGFKSPEAINAALTARAAARAARAKAKAEKMGKMGKKAAKGKEVRK